MQQLLSQSVKRLFVLLDISHSERVSLQTVEDSILRVFFKAKPFSFFFFLFFS